MGWFQIQDVCVAVHMYMYIIIHDNMLHVSSVCTLLPVNMNNNKHMYINMYMFMNMYTCTVISIELHPSKIIVYNYNYKMQKMPRIMNKGKQDD